MELSKPRRQVSGWIANGVRPTRRQVMAAGAAGALAGAPLATLAATAAAGTLTWGTHFSLAPTWFDPAETSGIITPYSVLYALHDAMVKPMPGQPSAPSLAESWHASEDGLGYEFVLREGVIFHNGEPVTAADVAFSFQRYRGTAHDMMKARVAAVEVTDPRRVRFRLKEPWPDFLTFYGNATGSGWVVPKAYVEKVGEDGFKRAPVGAGPYKFVSYDPGGELVMEAFDRYWRKPPSVKRIVFRGIPDESTRVAALKRGEIDIAYALTGELAEEVLRSPPLALKAAVVQTPFWVYFPDQWDPKSPWHDERVRRAASLAIDRDGLNQALTLGHSRLTGNPVVPDSFEFYWAPPPPAYDPAQAKQLLTAAGYSNGFDAGDFYCDAPFANIAEAVMNSLVAAGIRASLRPIERAAFFKSYADKKLKNLIMGASGAFGNAATRLEAFIVKGGAYAYGSYPDIDELFRQQAVELDRDRRKSILDRMQQQVIERAIAAPIWQIAALHGVGPRVGESGLGLIAGYPWTGPYEDMTLKAT
jgi:peptide/nickel transport system substrate-binding protein